MELLFLSLSLVLLLVTIARTILALKRRAGDSDTTRLPPGSLGWPILGETLEFLNGNPEKFIGDRMKKYSPHIFKTKILGENTVVFCGPDGNKFLFANEQKLTTVFCPHSTQKLFRSY
ncbi:hypothetical protein PVL29_013502 [Vitis rotundifolia]|uniref:Uncharacterized protein n=1 Tax=Vitis rotundifolia TaxID=103349 RepID=A0AA39DPV3_VITRO|nr:hypothetical protein PVL29_013502 [Vitis rotundifolia]